MARHWSLLSITDLHYQSPTNYIDDNKAAAGTPFLSRVFVNFNHMLKEGFGHPPKEFDLIAVCGDITTQGRKEGLEQFEREAIPLLDKLVGKREAICVVPGNHDVMWGLNPEEKRSFDRKFEQFLGVVQKTNVTSCLYPTGQDDGQDDLQLDPPKNGPLYVDAERKIMAACINSSIRCGEIDGKMQSEIEKPLKEAIEDLRGSGRTKTLESLRKLEKDLADYLLRDVRAEYLRVQASLWGDQYWERRRELSSFEAPTAGEHSSRHAVSASIKHPYLSVAYEVVVAVRALALTLPARLN